MQEKPRSRETPGRPEETRKGQDPEEPGEARIGQKEARRVQGGECESQRRQGWAGRGQQKPMAAQQKPVEAGGGHEGRQDKLEQARTGQERPCGSQEAPGKARRRSVAPKTSHFAAICEILCRKPRILLLPGARAYSRLWRKAHERLWRKTVRFRVIIFLKSRQQSLKAAWRDAH